MVDLLAEEDRASADSLVAFLVLPVVNLGGGGACLASPLTN
jgi:hypothetical protein